MDAASMCSMTATEVNLYQSSVRKMSDAELQTLSAELEEEYRQYDRDEDYWADDAAEARHSEMRREIWRRDWAAKHPDDPEGLTYRRPELPHLTAMALEFMRRDCRCFQFFATPGVVVGAAAESERKIGATITVRMPVKYRVQQGEEFTAQ